MCKIRVSYIATKKSRDLWDPTKRPVGKLSGGRWIMTIDNGSDGFDDGDGLQFAFGAHAVRLDQRHADGRL